MNVSNIISVDPAKKTLGAQHPEFTAEFLRNTVAIQQNEEKKRHSLSFLFGSSAPGVKKFGGYLLMFRAMFASMLIVSGSFILSGEISAPSSPLGNLAIGIGEIAVGTLICAGLFTRIAALVSSLFFLLMTIESISSGVFNLQAMMTLYGSLGFLFLGAGKFSCDSLISNALKSYSIRRRQRRQQERLSYKAFRNAI